MGLYIYEHPISGETIEIIQSADDKHEFYDGKGVKWNRVFTSPQISSDTQINPLDSKDFANKTGRKKGNIGDLIDQSREAAIKREQIVGKDLVKDQWKKDWSARRKGRKFPEHLHKDF